MFTELFGFLQSNMRSHLAFGLLDVGNQFVDRRLLFPLAKMRIDRDGGLNVGVPEQSAGRVNVDVRLKQRGRVAMPQDVRRERVPVVVLQVLLPIDANRLGRRVCEKTHIPAVVVPVLEIGRA